MTTPAKDVAPRPDVRPASAPGTVWLVLSICPHCTPANGGRYCSDHNATNWWLTSWGRRR